MIPLGLSSAEQAKFHAKLKDSHSIHVTVQVLSLEGSRLEDISDMLLDGQVDIDADADVTRSCSLTILDPRRSTSFDSDSPATGALFLDRMVRIVYSVNVPTIGWVDAPIFTGPVVKLDRTDDILNIEAQGKEVLAMGAVWSPMTFKKGANRAEVIETILRRRAGETKFSFPEFPHRLPRDLSVGRQSVPWLVAKMVARSMDKQLFYDGRGTARLRRLPGNPSFDFRSGTDGALVTQPQVAYGSDNVKNLVWVKGGVPRGEKKAIQTWLAAPRSHPLSPVRLGRNGVPRYLLETVENTNIRSLAEAKQVAKTRLGVLLAQHVDVTFDCLPIPHVEPMDMYRLATPEFAMSFRMRQASIPLTTGSAMSMGYLRRVALKRRGATRRRK